MEDRVDDQFGDGAPSDEEEVSALESLRAAKTHAFNRDLVYKMGEALGESESVEDLAAATEEVLAAVLCQMGHRSFTDRQLNKDCVKQLTRAFGDKLEDLAEAELAQLPEGGGADGKARNRVLGEVLKRVLDLVFDVLADKLARLGPSGVSPGAARLALKFMSEIIKANPAVLEGLSLTQSVEKVGVVLVTYLLDSRDAACGRQAEELLFSWLYGSKKNGRKGLVQQPNYKLFLRKDMPLGRLTILGRCLSSPESLQQGAKEEIEKELVSALESIVLDD